MLETLRIINTDFQAALDKFWRDYVARLPRDKTYDMNTADRALQRDRDVLNQVLNIRAQARRIDGILTEAPLRNLNQKEN